ncbi:hypothetical protein P7K49_003355 [Saguinus oedipus]|uniref:Uncharacterized protein n=1 Tax=Saguinus oedipus TaxID=9490 RepID=A0ABQ9WJX7_SAGOE|nr:hypothetical protein P7K49_003355 [Saguinus oedipus]
MQQGLGQHPVHLAAAPALSFSSPTAPHLSLRLLPSPGPPPLFRPVPTLGRHCLTASRHLSLLPWPLVGESHCSAWTTPTPSNSNLQLFTAPAGPTSAIRLASLERTCGSAEEGKYCSLCSISTQPVPRAIQKFTSETGSTCRNPGLRIAPSAAQ